jgi:hypothetical protein
LSGIVGKSANFAGGGPPDVGKVVVVVEVVVVVDAVGGLSTIWTTLDQ